jgi:hypothetical protein
MKTDMNKLFSSSAVNSDYSENKQDKIELISCPRKDMTCKQLLSVVNQCYVVSEHYLRERDYDRSIDTLKSAFYKTTELVEQPCSKCAALFRSTITESLENIHDELGKMSRGIFSKKRYQTSFLMSENVLKEFDRVKQSNIFPLSKSKDLFIGNYLDKKVS